MLYSGPCLLVPNKRVYMSTNIHIQLTEQSTSPSCGTPSNNDATARVIYVIVP